MSSCSTPKRILVKYTLVIRSMRGALARGVLAFVVWGRLCKVHLLVRSTEYLLYQVDVL
jgi:hypothetical protein